MNSDPDVQRPHADRSGTDRGVGPPILVTGSHRSGTTWVGTMLALAPGTLLVPKEPFNTNPRDYGLGGLAQHWFTYAPALPQRRAERAYERVLTGRTLRVLRRRTRPRTTLRYLLPWSHPRMIVHDPIAALSSEWLAERFGMAVVVLIRHPAAFAVSLRRLGWDFDFCNLLMQDELVEEHLGAFEAELRNPPADLVGRAGLVWNCLNSVLMRYADRKRDWAVVTHEELSLEPLRGFRELYDQLDLGWTPQVEAGVREHTSPENPVGAPHGVAHHIYRDSASNIRAWTARISSAEAARLREITEPVAQRFYGDEDWALDPSV